MAHRVQHEAERTHRSRSGGTNSPRAASLPNNSIRACLDRIAERESDVRAWAFISPDQAIAEARARDRGPRRGLLHGLPIAVKDVIDTADMPTEHGTPIYKGNQPACDAVCVSGARRSKAPSSSGKAGSDRTRLRAAAGTRNPTQSRPHAGRLVERVSCRRRRLHGAARVRHADRRLADTGRPSYCGIVGYKPDARFHQHGAALRRCRPTSIRWASWHRTVSDAALIGRALIGFDALDFGATSRQRACASACYRTPQWSLAEPPMASARSTEPPQGSSAPAPRSSK